MKKPTLTNSLGAVMTCGALLALSVGTTYAAKGSGGGGKKGGSSPSTSILGSVSGEAYSVDVDLKALVGLVSVKLGPTPYVSLPAAGGFDSETLLTISLPGIIESGTLANATAGGVGPVKAGSASISAVENLDLLNGLIKADVLLSVCSSRADGSTASSEASSTLANLFIGGKKIKAATAPNTTIKLLDGLVQLGTVTINEQFETGDGKTDSGITNNALHVKLNNYLLGLNTLAGDIIISSAHCDANATKDSQPPEPSEGGFVTGGGRLASGSGFASFGFNARPGQGQLQYNDHQTGLKFHGSTVTDFYIHGNCATYSGPATVSGTSGEYVVTACDNGEPGRNVDTFSIDLPNGYSNSGIIDGGNIQLH
ncbi:MAG: choice-of-anchor P family protein [Gammaproteobacteria bacterium]